MDSTYISFIDSARDRCWCQEEAFIYEFDELFSSLVLSLSLVIELQTSLGERIIHILI